VDAAEISISNSISSSMNCVIYIWS